MPSVKDIAICLRLMDWSETSQIAVLLSREHGKISTVAKGAKRQTPSTLAKFSGGLELLAVGEAVWIAKRTTTLATLTEWDLLDPQWHLRRDLRAYNLAMYAADLVHHLVQDSDPHPVTFEALRRFLRELGGTEPHAALLRFQWALVDDMGYRPVLDRDAQTGESLPSSGEALGFSATQGGTVADTGATDRWRVRRSTIELLRRVEAGEEVAAGESGSLERANRLLCVYFRAILDQQLPTMAFVLGE